MENQIETQEAQNQDKDEVENELYVSAGYYVRTGIIAGVPSPENGCIGCGS
ncbi:MAG: hypothetical protein HY784_16850 [Chloroflexi bacterium]|nr:hypothetical protein [Chloroflexota bacterium]